MKKLLSKISVFGMVNTMALMMVIHSVNSTCWWEFYQPEVPEGVKKLVK